MDTSTVTITFPIPEDTLGNDLDLAIFDFKTLRYNHKDGSTYLLDRVIRRLEEIRGKSRT